MSATPAQSQTGLSMPGGEELPPELTDSYLQKWYMERVANSRDGRIIIDGSNSGTGLGKTTLGCTICKTYDIWGWEPHKATLNPREYTVKYDQWRPASWAFLTEAEQAVDRRRSMSNESLEIGYDFATKRYRQVFGILDLPSRTMMDARIADKLCDLWIHVEERGKASLYEFDQNAFTGEVYYKKREELSWGPLDGDPDYEAVERKKVDHITGETERRFVTREEFEEAKENFWNKAEAKTTFEFVNSAYDASRDSDSPVDLTQSDIGEIVGMGQSNVSKMFNSDGFEDFYSSFDSS